MTVEPLLDLTQLLDPLAAISEMRFMSLRSKSTSSYFPLGFGSNIPIRLFKSTATVGPRLVVPFIGRVRQLTSVLLERAQVDG